MTNQNNGTVTSVFQQLSKGDPDAVTPIWNHYFPRLAKLAAHAISGTGNVAKDADDAVQSAFINFYQSAQKGGFPLDLDRDELGRLLATITIRKCRKYLRESRAQRRGGNRVIHESRLSSNSGDGMTLDQIAGDLQAEKLDIAFEESFRALDAEIQQIILLRWMGYSNEEISKRLGWSLRKVERKFAVARQTWTDLEQEDND